MNRLFKIIALGLALWALSLIWLELNILYHWPLFVGLIAGALPAYLLGHWLNRRVHRPRPPAAIVTRPTPRDPSVGPTRPSSIQTPQDRAAASTRPMPAL